MAWGSPFAGGDTSEVAHELAEDVQDPDISMIYPDMLHINAKTDWLCTVTKGFVHVPSG